MIPYPFKGFPRKEKTGRKSIFFDGLAQIESTGPDWKGPEKWVLWDFKAKAQSANSPFISANTPNTDDFFSGLQEWLSHEPRASEINAILKGQQ